MKNGRPASQGTCPVCGTKIERDPGQDEAKSRGWSPPPPRRGPRSVQPRQQLFRGDEGLAPACSSGGGPRGPPPSSDRKTSCTARATSAQNPCSPHRESGEARVVARARGRTSGRSGPRSRRRSRAIVISSGARASRQPPPAPRKLSTRPAFESAPSCCSRNRTGICWRSAISRAGTRTSSSRCWASSIMARIAYSSFWEILSTGPPRRPSVGWGSWSVNARPGFPGSGYEERPRACRQLCRGNEGPPGGGQRHRGSRTRDRR